MTPTLRDATANIGDVVQIDPSMPKFGGMFAIVDERKSWGVTARVHAPDSQGSEAHGVWYPVRLEFGKFYRIGLAAVMPRDIVEKKARQ